MSLRTITEAEWIELVTSNDRRAAEIMALNQKLATARTAAEQALEAELEPCKRRLNFGGDVMDPRDTPAYKPGTTAPPNAKVAAGGAPRLWRGGYSELLRLLRINPIRR